MVERSSSSVERDAHRGGGARTARRRARGASPRRAATGAATPTGPRAHASAAPAPKISTGTYSGRTSSASRLPPPRAPSVSAAPIAAEQRQDRRAEQQRRRDDRQHVARRAPYCSPSSGASTTSGSPVVSQCASDLAGDAARAADRATARSARACRRRSRRRTGAAATSSDASSAATQRTPGPSAASSARSGDERAERGSPRSRRTASWTREFRARAQRDAQVARDGPAQRGDDAVVRRVRHGAMADSPRTRGSSLERSSSCQAWSVDRQIERLVRRGDDDAAGAQALRDEVREQREARVVERGGRLVEQPQRRAAAAQGARGHAPPLPCDSDARRAARRCAARSTAVERRATSRRASPPRPRARASARRFSSAVSSSFSAAAVAREGARARACERGRARRSASPRLPRGSVKPARMRSSVVLPLPLRPVTSNARPASTRKRRRGEEQRGAAPSGECRVASQH